MTAPDRLQVLLDRACRGLTSDESAVLRAAVHQLRQRAAGSERQYELAMEGWNRETDAQDQRAARYRAAWQSARRRARLVPEAGQEIHDGTRWRPALQAYSALRARLARAEQELAALREGEQPYEDERVVPTPGQWIWQWNRATPEQRLAKAAQVLDMRDRLDLVRQALVCHGDRPNLADAMRAALDGRSPDVQVKQACDHRDPNRLGMRRDLATVCACGHVLFPPVLPASPQTPEPRTHESHIWEDEDGWHVSCEHYDCPDSSRDVGSEYDAEEWAEQHRAEAMAEDAAWKAKQA